MRPNGFTLIELMVVLIIIGILSAIGIPMYQDYIKRTHVTTSIQWVSPIKQLLALHYMEHGDFPEKDYFTKNYLSKSRPASVSALEYDKGTKSLEIQYNKTISGDDKATAPKLVLRLKGTQTADTANTDKDANSSLTWECILPSTNGLDKKWAPSDCEAEKKA